MTTAPPEPPKYPKGDLRRMLCVLAALDDSETTLVQIARRTGLDKKTVQNLLFQAGAQAGVVIVKDGPSYAVADWGPVIKSSGARKALQGALNAPTV